MPELPEVETIKRGLEKHFVGCVISDAEVLSPKILTGDVGNVIGTTVVAVRRFGKGLVIDLNNGYSMAVHVKMTGQLIFKRVSRVSGVSSVLPKHTHVVFELRDGTGEDAYLYYNDIRRFGWIKIVKTEDVGQMPFFKSLGLEPLKDLTQKKFEDILKLHKTPIKTLLMDQYKIAGIGNIYACDALFQAGIYPVRSSLSLSRQEAQRLFIAIEEILSKSIAIGGASANNYVNALGERGAYQEHFLVYKKEGKACRNCNSPILRIKTAGRSTFFCGICQV